jgi:hypothetical protein
LIWLHGKKEEKNYAGSEKCLPTLIKEIEPLWYCIAYRYRKTPPPKGKEKINEDLRKVAGLTVSK